MVSVREGEAQYQRLTEYFAVRRSELTGMTGPYIQVTDAYGELTCSLVLALGEKPPGDIQDEACRDLMADAFDFLYDSRRAIAESQFSVAFPLLRRAFESISLLAACASDGELAQAWASGEEVPNAEVRKRLDKDPIREPLESTRELYSFFSRGAHPNRDVVPFRFLGKTNQFVLGAVGRPDLLVFCDHLRHHLSLWFWFCAAVTFHYRELSDMPYGEKYLRTAASAREVAASLESEITRLQADPTAR